MLCAWNFSLSSNRRLYDCFLHRKVKGLKLALKLARSVLPGYRTIDWLYSCRGIGNHFPANLVSLGSILSGISKHGMVIRQSHELFCPILGQCCRLCQTTGDSIHLDCSYMHSLKP